MNEWKILLVFAVAFVFAPVAGAVSMPEKDSLEAARCLAVLEEKPHDRTALTKLISIYGRFHQVEMENFYTDLLFSEYRDSDDADAKMTAYAYKGVNHLGRYEYGPARECFDVVISLADSVESSGGKINGSALVMAYNGLAVSDINENLNFERAITYFMKVLRIMGPDFNAAGRGGVKSNIVLSYFFLENPAGIKYADELYDEGVRSGNGILTFLGTYGCAMMEYVNKDYGEAERHIEEALASEYIDIDASGVYTLYANVLRETGRKDEAEKMYRKAIDLVDEESFMTANTYLNYGEFLFRNGDFDRALDILRDGTDVSEKIGSKVNLFRFMALMSECCEKMGKWHEALVFHKEYKRYSDSTFNIQRERDISELQMRYEQARYNASLSEKEVMLEKKNSIIMVLSASVLLVVSVLVLIWIMYREKNRMYAKIARQYKSAIRREKMMEDIGDASRISKDKSEELFSKLEMLMIKDKVFRDSEMSRDKVAEMMNTNRTYLSNVVNERTGESFNQYLNRYRINYALHLMDENGNDYPMKAIVMESGFNSPATFYKAFKDIVGMTPTKYKEQSSAVK